MAKNSRPIDIERLCVQMGRARLSLQKPREERVRMVERYAGAHWGPYGRAVKDDPVNLLGMYVSVMGQSLLAHAPRVMLSTFDRAQKPAVAAMQDWVNREIERTGLSNTLQRAVLDALFCMGIVKVGIATPSDAACKAWSLVAGQPFAERVDFDDFVFDIHARDLSECSFMGHRYRVPLETVRDSPLYTSARKHLTASSDKLHNEPGDERISVLGRGWLTGNDEEFEEMVDLWEVYLPRDRVVLTLADDDLTGVQPSAGEGLRRQNWIGPDTGPYIPLGLWIVPGNAMPKAPIQDLWYLHDKMNVAVRKAVRGMERTKVNTLVQGQAEADAKRVQESSDGDLVRVDNPDNFKQLLMGPEAVQSTVGVAAQIYGWFNQIAGNLEVIGGRGSEAKTAHQEELLNQNASAGVSDLQDKTIAFVSKAIESLCWFWWNHPTAVMKSEYSPQGGVSHVREVHPYDPQSAQHEARVAGRKMMRSGRFEDLQVSVDPYSLARATPESRVADLDQFMTQIFVPLAPLLQSQGIAIDMQQYLKKRAFYRNMPDLPEILTMQSPPAPQGGVATGGQGQPRMPASTNRTYTRRNVSTKTPQGQRAALVNNLLSGKAQGGQGV